MLVISENKKAPEFITLQWTNPPTKVKTREKMTIIIKTESKLIM